MNQLFDQTIKVTCFEGKCGRWRRPCLVDAVIVAPFAIHPTVGQFSRHARVRDRFTVTHLSTGISICRHRTLRGAVGFVNAVRGLDWSVFDLVGADCRERCFKQFSYETAAELFPDIDAVVTAAVIWRWE